jgi:hypothetical protein
MNGDTSARHRKLVHPYHWQSPLDSRLGNTPAALPYQFKMESNQAAAARYTTNSEAEVLSPASTGAMMVHYENRRVRGLCASEGDSLIVHVSLEGESLSPSWPSSCHWGHHYLSLSCSLCSEWHKQLFYNALGREAYPQRL